MAGAEAKAEAEVEGGDGEDADLVKEGVSGRHGAVAVPVHHDVDLLCSEMELARHGRLTMRLGVDLPEAPAEAAALHGPVTLQLLLGPALSADTWRSSQHAVRFLLDGGHHVQVVQVGPNVVFAPGTPSVLQTLEASPHMRSMGGQHFLQCEYDRGEAALVLPGQPQPHLGSIMDEALRWCLRRYDRSLVCVLVEDWPEEVPVVGSDNRALTLSPYVDQHVLGMKDPPAVGKLPSNLLACLLSFGCPAVRVKPIEGDVEAALQRAVIHHVGTRPVCMALPPSVQPAVAVAGLPPCTGTGLILADPRVNPASCMVDRDLRVLYGAAFVHLSVDPRPGDCSSWVFVRGVGRTPCTVVLQLPRVCSVSGQRMGAATALAAPLEVMVEVGRVPVQAGPHPHVPVPVTRCAQRADALTRANVEAAALLNAACGQWSRAEGFARHAQVSADVQARWKGADPLQLLRQAQELLHGQGGGLF